MNLVLPLPGNNWILVMLELYMGELRFPGIYGDHKRIMGSFTGIG